MNYQSPVDLIISEMNLRLDGEILKAVQNVGVNVDRDELIKALRYDRDQYKKGYADRDEEIVRCRDCKWRGTYACFCKAKDDVQDDWFCSEGERADT